MKIGLAQMDMVWENKEKNLIIAENFIQDAVKKKIDYLLFPEMSLTGFSMNVNKIGEQSEKQTTLSHFSTFSKQYKIFLGIGYVENGNEKSKNHFAVLNPLGEIIADYVKIHPFSYGDEGNYYTGGRKIEYCNIQDIITAPFICYDLRFPEIFQIASKTAHLITVAANWPKERKEHWLTLLKARAIENQCYIAGVNRIGYGNGIQYIGDSIILNPYGEIISSAIEKECIVSAQIDKSIVLKYRADFKLKEDRKEVLYQQL